MWVHHVGLLMALGIFMSFWLRVFSGVGSQGGSSIFLDCERDLSTSLLPLKCNNQLPYCLLIHIWVWGEVKFTQLSIYSVNIGRVLRSWENEKEEPWNNCRGLDFTCFLVLHIVLNFQSGEALKTSWKCFEDWVGHRRHPLKQQELKTTHDVCTRCPSWHRM